MICVAKIGENLHESAKPPDLCLDLCLLSILGVIMTVEIAEEVDIEGREHGTDGARQKKDGRGGGAADEAAEMAEEVDNGMKLWFQTA